MSSPIDYILMKSLDKCVVIIINLMSSSRISTGFMKRNTILALDELCYHRPLYCLPSNTNLFVFCVIPWVPCYPAFILLYLGVLPSFMSIMSWGLLHLLRILAIVILLTITILSWSPCWFQQVNVVVRILSLYQPYCFEVNGRPFILRLLSIESPFQCWSCNPAHISGAPFNHC